MLRAKQLRRHQDFLSSLLDSNSVKKVRRRLSAASLLQLRTLIVLLATVVLRKVPVSPEVEKIFRKTRKKSALRVHFSSWAKVTKLLRKKNRDEWERVLSEVGPTIQPAISVFFHNEH